MATITEIVSSKVKKIDDAPGESLSVTGEGAGKKSEDHEMYFLPGIFSKPQPNEIGVAVTVGETSIIVGTQNYKAQKALDNGEVIIFSHNSDGIIQGSVYVKKDGNVIINDGTKEAARNGDTTKLVMSPTDIATLAAAILATGVFVPTGNPPVPGPSVTFTGGEITQGTTEVLLP